MLLDLLALIEMPTLAVALPWLRVADRAGMPATVRKRARAAAHAYMWLR